MTVAVVLSAGGFLWAGPDSQVGYPDGYRSWVHVRSILVGPRSHYFEKFGGLYHTYANEKAMEGYRTGKFPEGSVLISDRLEAPEKDGVATPGKRIATAVMVKDSRKYADTGGWAFDGFKGDSHTEHVSKEVAAACWACHQSQKDHDCVFSSFQE
jgi:hypothetical protein